MYISEITNKIPLPATGRGFVKSFIKMQPGDFLEVIDREVSYKKLMIRVISSSRYFLKKKGLDWVFKTVKIEGGVKITRIK